METRIIPWINLANYMLSITVAVMGLAGMTNGQFRSGSYNLGNKQVTACPITSAKKSFDLNKFYGDWYVLEYEYPKQMQLRDISCVGLHFSEVGFGNLMSNFTFRFPAKTGHFYHVPTFSLITKVESSVWETQFRGVELISIIIDTDYSNWAVLSQCNELGSGEPQFLSTRILSRTRDLGAGDWIRVQTAIENAKASAKYRYPIDQKVCQEIDGI